MHPAIQWIREHLISNKLVIIWRIQAFASAELLFGCRNADGSFVFVGESGPGSELRLSNRVHGGEH